LDKYGPRQHYLAFVANDFLVSQLLRVVHAFDGDVLSAIVLGEIAHHNVHRFFCDHQSTPAESVERVLADPQRRDRLSRPCNALSISRATGLPRETVRRRIVHLVAQGWVMRRAHGHLYAADAVVERFARFHLETAKSLVETAKRVTDALAIADDPVSERDVLAVEPPVRRDARAGAEI
jgi:hypothetical protein